MSNTVQQGFSSHVNSGKGPGAKPGVTKSTSAQKPFQINLPVVTQAALPVTYPKPTHKFSTEYTSRGMHPRYSMEDFASIGIDLDKKITKSRNEGKHRYASITITEESSDRNVAPEKNKYPKQTIRFNVAPGLLANFDFLNMLSSFLKTTDQITPLNQNTAMGTSPRALLG